jgi:hypothetical protein
VLIVGSSDTAIKLLHIAGVAKPIDVLPILGGFGEIDGHESVRELGRRGPHLRGELYERAHATRTPRVHVNSDHAGNMKRTPRPRQLIAAPS